MLFSNKMNYVLPFATTWMGIISEISQTANNKYHIISLISEPEETKQNRMRHTFLKNKLIVAKGVGGKGIDEKQTNQTHQKEGKKKRKKH